MNNQKAKIILAVLVLLVFLELGYTVYERFIKEGPREDTLSQVEEYYKRRSSSEYYFGGHTQEDLPVQYSLVHENKPLSIAVTGYAFFKPTEVIIQNPEQLELDPEQLLEQLRKQYGQLFLCHQDPPIEDRCSQPDCFCVDERIQDFMRLPAWNEVNLASWEWEIIEEEFILRKRQDIEEKITLEKLEVSSTFDHNHQVLSYFEFSHDQGVITEDTTLIHFDTHSDFFIYGNPNQFKESIADYINTLISRKWITEMYWVLPDWTKRDEVKHIYWSDGGFDNPYGGHSYGKGPLDLAVYIGEDGTLFFEETPNTKKILIKRIVLDDLPDEFDSEFVFVDLDADYFSNSGYDTEVQANINPTTNELLVGLQQFVSKMKVLSPDLLTVSFSPGYVPEEDYLFLKNYFEN